MRILVAGGRHDEASPLSFLYESANNAWTAAP
jgi:hypothetical protein